MNTTTSDAPHKQRFAVVCERASLITLVGDFTQWHENPLFLQKGDDGVWEVMAELAPGTYHFRLIVDQEPDNGPDDIVQVPGPDGSPGPIHREL